MIILCNFSSTAAGVDDEQLVKDVEEKIPSLPIAYWTKHKAIQAQANSKTKQCAKYPSIFDLQFNNMYWQVRHRALDLVSFRS